MCLLLYVLILLFELALSLHKKEQIAIKGSFADKNKSIIVILVVTVLTLLLLIVMKIAIDLANRGNAQELQNKEKKYKIITEEILIKNKNLFIEKI